MRAASGILALVTVGQEVTPRGLLEPCQPRLADPIVDTDPVEALPPEPSPNQCAKTVLREAWTGVP